MANYAFLLGHVENVATSTTFNDIWKEEFLRSPKENVYSAFDPSLGGPGGWTSPYFDRFERDLYEPDKFNNWGVDFPHNNSGYQVTGLDQSNLIAGWTAEGLNPENFTRALQFYSRMVPRQLWVLTSNSSLVCTLGNATRDVYVNFINDTQYISYGELQNFKPVRTFDPPLRKEEYPY